MFRCCPPGPLPRRVVHWRSDGSIRRSMGSGSGRTATVTVLVWTRPRRSVGGTRCHRWPPASLPKATAAAAPETRRTISPGRSSITSSSKIPPQCSPRVDACLFAHEQFRVGPALGSPNFYHHEAGLYAITSTRCGPRAACPSRATDARRARCRSASSSRRCARTSRGCPPIRRRLPPR